jgi:hypothetical protein
MKLEPVQGSSVIAGHGYDQATGKLRVKLHSGKTYDYDGVSIEKYAAFTGAASPGSFYNSKIKANHNHTEVGHPEKRK